MNEESGNDLDRPASGGAVWLARTGRLFRIGIAVGWHSARLLVRTAGHWPAVRQGRRTRVGEELANLCEALGPAFVKVGQLLSARRDLLPAEVVAPLRRLQDRLAPIPFARILRAVESSLACSLGEVFAHFDPEPVATASIAQVHRARLHGRNGEPGRDVAVKVRRPGIVRRVERDLDLLLVAATFMARFAAFRRLPVEPAVRQVVSAIVSQLDLRLEAENHRRLRFGLREHTAVRLPELIDRLCREDLLVMEFVEPLWRLDDPALPEPAYRRAITGTLRALYAMLFEVGCVHCDLHPGNVFAAPEGVVILDCGFVAHLSDEERGAFRDFFIGWARNDGMQCARVLRERAIWCEPDFDPAGFDREVGALVGRTSGLAAGEFRVAPFVAELFDLQRRLGLCGAPDFTLAILSLLVFEGLVRHRFVDLDFQSEAMPFAALSLIESARLF